MLRVAFGAIGLLLWAGATFAACETTSPTTGGVAGNPFAPSSAGKLGDQTLDNARITGGCIDVPDLQVSGVTVNPNLSRSLTSFDAVCNGTTDDAAAFAAATAWLATGPNERIVTIPAKTCATSQTVTIGDGRQHSTTLSSGLSGSETSIPVTTCTGIQSGDTIIIVANAGTAQSKTASGACSGGSVPITGSWTGGAASAGNAVFTGHASTYDGGGFVGYGSSNTAGLGAVSTIKYIGAAAPSTTLGATASAGDVTITVASIANINIGDPLGITLDTGAVWWTHVNQSPTGTSVKLMNEIPSTATSGNAVQIANVPVVRIAGPINAVRLDGIALDANSLASTGLETRSSRTGKHRGNGGVTALNYTGIGHNITSARASFHALPGTTDSEYELYALSPANQNTIGCWLRGTAGAASSGLAVAWSRNRLYGGNCKQGGASTFAAGIRIEHIDNNNWDKPYASTNGAGLGAGLYRQPSFYRDGFPLENYFTGPAFIGGLVEGSATGVTLGNDFIAGYATGDSESMPTLATAPFLSGHTFNGQPFGVLSITAGAQGGLRLTRATNSQITVSVGAAADSTSYTLLVLSTACTASLATSGDKGIDTNSVRQSSTWYAVYIVGSYITGKASCMIAQAASDSDIPTLALPANFSFSAYLGRFQTDGSSNIATTSLIYQKGQKFVYGDTTDPSVSPRLVHTGGRTPDTAADATDTTPATTETYIAEMFVPANVAVTGVAILNGSAIASNIKVGLTDSTGAVVCSSVSTVASGTDTFQRVPFSALCPLKGPGTYYILLQSNNVAYRFRSHPAPGNFGASKKTGETYNTLTTITPPTTFTAGQGPVATLY